MKKIKLNNWKIILGIIFVISMSIFSIQLIIPQYYQLENIIITGIISGLFSIYIYIKTYKENYEYIKKNKIFNIIIICFTLFVLYRLHINKIHLIPSDVQFNPLRLRFFIISVISAIYLAIYIGNKVKSCIINFYHSLDEWDKKAYIIASVMSILVILIAYNTNNDWYAGYDKIYSLDSGYVFHKFLNETILYDVRHPIFTVFVFPIATFINMGVNVILPKVDIAVIVKAIIIQIINSQLLILIGMMLKKLTKNKLVFIVYMLSYPTIMYSLFLEKYQLCVFLLVLYVYVIITNKEKSIPSLIMASGVMPTSCVIGIAEFFTKDTLKNKLRKVLKIFVLAIVIFICLGRINIFRNGFADIKQVQSGFAYKEFDRKEEIIATTKVIQNAFIGLPSEIMQAENTHLKYLGNQNIYLWKNLQTQVAPVAYVVIVLVVIGAIENRKKLFTKIASIWCVFLVILFLGIKWSIPETPLFSIYFSWAIIPLTIMGIDVILEKLKLNKKIVYTFLILIMVVINTSQIIGLSNILPEIVSTLQTTF